MLRTLIIGLFLLCSTSLAESYSIAYRFSLFDGHSLVFGVDEAPGSGFGVRVGAGIPLTTTSQTFDFSLNATGIYHWKSWLLENLGGYTGIGLGFASFSGNWYLGPRIPIVLEYALTPEVVIFLGAESTIPLLSSDPNLFTYILVGFINFAGGIAYRF